MELAQELRNNLHPYPSAHSPYGNSTLSPGSQGLPPDSSVMALFNASATNTRQLLPLASYPLLWGLGVQDSDLRYLFSSSLVFLPIFSENTSDSCPFPFCFWSIPVLEPLFFSPQDAESGEPRN
uniref:Uncharacterized protein n=1 Tax=Gorilla gorilla gorilla TaxID=9595 RepID=A0A2I2ZVP2_GORGO